MHIARWVNFNGVAVPQSTTGQYLDWTKASDDDAPLPHSPYGAGSFRVGNEQWYFAPDWCVMPDGRILIDMDCGNVPWDEDALLRQWGPDDYIWLEPPGEAPGTAWALTEHMLRDLEARGVQHDAEWAGGDAFAFFRTLTKQCGVPPYDKMRRAQLFAAPVKRGVKA